MSKERSRIDPENYPRFLRVYPNDVNLKFVFDNLRNYGIAAVLFYTGIVIFRDGTSSAILSFHYSGEIIGVVIMALAFILAVLNFIQGTIAMLVVKIWRMVTYVAFSLLMHIVLFEAFFKRALQGM